MRRYFQSLRFSTKISPHNVVANRFRSSCLSEAEFANVSLSVMVHRMRRSDGNVVAPTWQTIQACASNDVFNTQTTSFALHWSTNPACYPLAEAIYLRVKKSKCDLQTDPGPACCYQALPGVRAGSLPRELMVSQTGISPSSLAGNWLTGPHLPVTVCALS